MSGSSTLAQRWHSLSFSICGLRRGAAPTAFYDCIWWQQPVPLTGSSQSEPRRRHIHMQLSRQFRMRVLTGDPGPIEVQGESWSAWPATLTIQLPVAAFQPSRWIYACIALTDPGRAQSAGDSEPGQQKRVRLSRRRPNRRTGSAISPRAGRTATSTPYSAPVASEDTRAVASVSISMPSSSVVGRGRSYALSRSSSSSASSYRSRTQRGK